MVSVFCGVVVCARPRESDAINDQSTPPDRWIGLGLKNWIGDPDR